MRTGLLCVAATLGLAGLAPGATWYVATNGSDAAAGTLVEPFATITNAYAHCVSNDVVSVGPGTYVIPKVGGPEDAWLTMDKAVALVSQEGPGTTILDGQNVQNNRAFVMSHPMAVVSGFTVRRVHDNIDYQKHLSGTFHVLDGTITNCVIRDNDQFYLAAVTLYRGRIVDSVVRDNRTRDSLSVGAGIYLANSQARAERCTVSGNSGTRGPGIYCPWNVFAVATDCIIETNIVRYTNRGETAPVHFVSGTAQNCIIRGNTSGLSGGVFLEGGTLRNSLVCDNTAAGTSSAGGIYIKSGTVDGCTVAGNRSVLAGTGHGLYQAGGTVRNTIVAYNSMSGFFADEGNYRWISGTRGYVCTYPAQTGTGNIAQNPCFADYKAFDYRLSPASPCRDAGSVSAWMSGGKDVFGNDRIIGGVPDIGAYEMAAVGSLPFGCDIDVPEIMCGLAPFEVVFAGLVYNPPAETVEYLWDFGNGQTAAGRVVTNAFDIGRHSGVTLTVTSGGQSVSRSLPDTFISGSITAYVSTNGASVWPYHTPALAATNFQDALEAVILPPGVERGTVHVAAGAYTLRPTSDPNLPNISLWRPIALRGAGPGLTIIDGGDIANNRGIQIRHAGASVDGVTLRRIKSNIASFEEGGALHVAAGTASNCVIDRCIGFYAAPVYLKNGLITDCLIVTNQSTDSLSQGGGISINGGGVLRNSSIIGNKGKLGCGLYIAASSAATVSGCDIEGNIAEATTRGQSGALYLLSGTVERCIVRNNTGRKGGGAWLSGGTIRNSLFVGNADIQNAAGGGGIHMAGGTVESCTITGNGATEAGAAGGAYLDVAGAVLRNSVVWDNDGSDVKLAAGSVTYTCSGEPLAGAGNLSGNPLFRNAGRGDYTLRVASPCVDVGSDQPWMADALDLAGNPRIRYAAVDLGAYETTANPGTRLLVR